MNFLDVTTTTQSETPSRPPTTGEIIIGLVFFIIIIIAVIIGGIIAKKNEEKWVQEHSRPLSQEELKLFHDINVKNYIEKSESSDMYRIYDENGRFLAVYECIKENRLMLKPVKMFLER